MSVVISVEYVSKQYRLGEVGTGTLSHDVNRWWHKFRGKEDPYLKIGESNDRSKKGDSEYSWALRDVSFEVKQGEVLGIIGRNGAGKSTLLKILSRVTTPTTGEIKVKGRIASLLEVGTGFHPELTGRENIYINGAILGMRKHEITRKLDEIIEFSGCERYIDTPVKRYSSGMYVRLAFAVAAHLEPEILIVDEVLAVGDAEFQKKCLGKMKDVAGEGRTVLFVSHQMSTIRRLCNRVMVMNSGKVFCDGDTSAALGRYAELQTLNIDCYGSISNRSGSGELRYIDVSTSKDYFAVHDEKIINFSISQKSILGCGYFISGVIRSNEVEIFQFDGRMLNQWLAQSDALDGRIIIKHPWLKPGVYQIDLYICSANVIIDEFINATSMLVIDEMPFPGIFDPGAYRLGTVIPDFSIHIKSED